MAKIDWSDPKAYRAYRAAYRAARSPEAKERQRLQIQKWRKGNPLAVAGWSANWRKKNRQKWLECRDMRRRAMRTVVGECSDRQWMWRVEYYGWHCAYCRCALDVETLTRDHQIPIACGGSNWPANLVPACKSCNSKKGKKLPTSLKR